MPKLYDHAIVIWGRPLEKSPELITNLLNTINESVGQEIKWFIESKKKTFNKSNVEIIRLVEKARDKKLGFINLAFDSIQDLSFCISLNSPKSVRNFDVVTMDFNKSHIEGEDSLLNYDRMLRLFIKMLKLFAPFWGVINSTKLGVSIEEQRYRHKLDREKIPESFYGINYFGADMIENLGGKEKILHAPVERVEEINNPPGIIMILQKRLIDFKNIEDINKIKKVENYFKLKELHNKYQLPPRTKHYV